MPIENASPPKKVALIQDWLNGYRGGERVLEEICKLYPNADIFTLFYEPGKVSPTVERHKITVSYLNRIPFAKRIYRHLLPLMPSAIERFDLSAYDLVISSSHCVAKGVIPAPDALHICYCHTPMRYAWDQYRAYFGTGWKEKLIYPFIHFIRQWDVTSSHRVDHFIANSAWVAGRIEKYYRRPSRVIHPFADLDSFRPQNTDRREYYVVVTALVPYKRVDLAIAACKKLGRKLVIVGNGNERAKLEHLAGDSAEFLGALSLERLKEVYAGAHAMIFPGEEDFGIAPVEAMACGLPVIAYNRGGLTETVVDGETGVLYSESSAEGLADAILRFESLRTTISSRACRARAEKFSRARFAEEFRSQVAAWWKERTHVAQAPISAPEILQSAE